MRETRNAMKRRRQDSTFNKTDGNHNNANYKEEHKRSNNHASPSETYDTYLFDPLDYHRRLVTAVMEIGTRLASPSQIFEQMTHLKGTTAEGSGFEDLTLERIKSHLQRFRKVFFDPSEGRTKTIKPGKKSFLDEYDSFVDFGMEAAQAILTKNADFRSIEGGRVIGLISRMIMIEEDIQFKESGRQSIGTHNHLRQTDKQSKSGTEMNRIITKIPRLSSSEISSPLGLAIELVIGLLEYLNEYILRKRLDHQELANHKTHQFQYQTRPELTQTLAAAFSSMRKGQHPESEKHHSGPQETIRTAPPREAAVLSSKEITFRKLWKVLFVHMDDKRITSKVDIDGDSSMPGGMIRASRGVYHNWKRESDGYSSSELSSLSSISSSEEDSQSANDPPIKSIDEIDICKNLNSSKSWIFDEFPTNLEKFRFMLKPEEKTCNSTNDDLSSSACSCCSPGSVSPCTWYLSNNRPDSLNQEEDKHQDEGGDESDISSLGFAAQALFSHAGNYINLIGNAQQSLRKAEKSSMLKSDRPMNETINQNEHQNGDRFLHANYYTEQHQQQQVLRPYPLQESSTKRSSEPLGRFIPLKDGECDDVSF